MATRARGETRHDRGKSVVESTDARSEGIVDEVACERLLVFRQRAMKEPARDAIGDLYRRILALLLPSGHRRRLRTGVDLRIVILAIGSVPH